MPKSAKLSGSRAWTGRNETRIRGQYDDLLEEREDLATLQLLADLDTGYRAVSVPPTLRGWTPRRLAGGNVRLADPPEPSPYTRFRKSGAVALLGVLIFVVASTITVAGDNFTNLGKPTNDVPRSPQRLLGAFYRRGPVLYQGAKPQILFIGTMVESFSSAERWPFVKALQQFGRFVGVSPSSNVSCDQQYPSLTVQCHPNSQLHSYATYDLSKAKFVSRYISLSYTDLVDHDQNITRTVSPTVRSLFNRYVSGDNIPLSSRGSWDQTVWATAGQFESMTRHEFPLISIGGYLQTGPGFLTPGDLMPAISTNALPFATIQDSIRLNRAVKDAVRYLPRDANLETNLLTALICHADHLQPASVCNRAAIRTLVRAIR